MASIVLANYAAVTFGDLRSNLQAFVADKGDSCMREGVGTLGFKPDCLGVPDQKSILCPAQTPSAKTTHIGVKVEIFFRNTNDEDALLYWVNEFGDEKFEMMLPAWESTPQMTYFGHVFRVRNKGGRLLLEHTVGLIPLRNDAQIADVASIQNDERSTPGLQSDCQHAKTPDAVEVGFINRAGFPLKLFSSSALGDRELTLQLENDTIYPLCAYKGKVLEAYTVDGRHVTSAKIGEIIVASCQDPAAEVAPDLSQTNLPIRVMGDATRDKTASVRVDLHGKIENVECTATFCVMKPVRTSNTKKSLLTWT
jgi:hypothetical protein